MPWAVAAAAVSAGGGMYQADASKSAAQTQAQGGRDATNAQMAMFNTVNQNQQPYRNAGNVALNQILTGFGQGPQDGSGPLTPDQVQKIYQTYMGRSVQPDEMQSLMSTNSTASQLEKSVATSPEAQYHANTQKNVAPVTQPIFTDGSNTVTAGPGQTGGVSLGQFSHQFDANDLGTNLDPSYNFRRDQTLGAATNLLNKSGSTISGNTLKGVMDYGNNLATTGYQQAFENYNTNQSNIYNRLASIAGLGQTAGSNSSTGASSFSSGAASSMQNAATAAAGGQVGAANALAGGANNAASWYSLGQISKPTGTAAGGSGGFSNAELLAG